MAVDPPHRYSNEAERSNKDINNDFNKKKLCSYGLHKNISSLYGLKTFAAMAPES